MPSPITYLDATFTQIFWSKVRMKLTHSCITTINVLTRYHVSSTIALQLVKFNVTKAINRYVTSGY